MSEEKPAAEAEPTSESSVTGDAAKSAEKPDAAKSAEKPTGDKPELAATNSQSETRAAMARAEEALRAVEQAELEAKLAAERAAAARKEAEAAAEAEYKAIAAQVKADVAKKENYTFKRQSEEIFRRDMGEPEFYLDKKDRFPRPILTPQQQESVTRKVEVPRDQTPKYVPERILSPEFNGISNYERGVEAYLEEVHAALKVLKRNPESDPKEIAALKEKISYLESLYENFYIGMNVFRTARGGRSK